MKSDSALPRSTAAPLLGRSVSWYYSVGLAYESCCPSVSVHATAEVCYLLYLDSCLLADAWYSSWISQIFLHYYIVTVWLQFLYYQYIITFVRDCLFRAAFRGVIKFMSYCAAVLIGYIIGLSGPFSVWLSVSYGPVTWKQRDLGEPNLVWMFSVVGWASF